MFSGIKKGIKKKMGNIYDGVKKKMEGPEIHQLPLYKNIVHMSTFLNEENFEELLNDKIKAIRKKEEKALFKKKKMTNLQAKKNAMEDLLSDNYGSGARNDYMNLKEHRGITYWNNDEEDLEKLNQNIKDLNKNNNTHEEKAKYIFNEIYKYNESDSAQQQKMVQRSFRFEKFKNKYEDGLKGEKGDIGATGEQGLKGDKGATGDKGDQGIVVPKGGGRKRGKKSKKNRKKSKKNRKKSKKNRKKSKKNRKKSKKNRKKSKRRR